MQAKVLKSELHIWIWIQVPPAKSAMEQPQRKTRDVKYGPENQEFLVWWTGVFICWWGTRDNGIQRASKKFNISRSREFIATICHSFLCPMLELRISGACKVALPEASSAVTPFVPKVLQCGGYIFVFRIFWELSSWKLQFEHVNLSGRFDFLHFLPRNLEQCVCVCVCVNRQL